MSRGGRGGGRGGRGGGRGGRPNVPWDTGDEPDGRPSELFPAYPNFPTARSLSAAEGSGIQYFLLLRHQIHSSPLYTSKRTSTRDPTAPRKLYGQTQMNSRFDIKSKASLDPFTAVPTYSHKFVPEERALPDWSNRPVCRELFPDELLDTVEPQEGVGGGARKKRKLELTSVSALPNAEEAFGMPSLEGGGDAENGRNLLERLDALRDEEGEEGAEADEEEAPEDEQDQDYDDSDAGDYDAENYFDNGDEGMEDMGDGDEGEGTF